MPLMVRRLMMLKKPREDPSSMIVSIFEDSSSLMNVIIRCPNNFNHNFNFLYF